MALRTAIKYNDKETINKLIKRVNAADVRDYDGSTLLHMAIEIGTSEIIEFFIDKGCDVNAQDRNGATPLLIALKFSRWQAVKKLLEEKANLFIADNTGINALKFPFKINQMQTRVKLINLLTKHLRVRGINGKELAPLILEAGWPLHYAINIQNSELIKLMIEAGCPINSRDEFTSNVTALYRAIINKDPESTKILLQYGADIDIYHESYGSPFMAATFINPRMSFEIFEIFLRRELQRFNTDGIIHSYASFLNANDEVIKLLAKYKVNLTTKDRNGSTILHNLVHNTSQEVVNLILEEKVDVNNKDNKGNTALYYAVADSSINCLQALIHKGADINAKNENGHTPLINAVNHRESEKVIEILMKNGAILDEEMQNRILNHITNTNIEISSTKFLLKHMAIIHLQSEAVSKRNNLLIKNNSSIHEYFELYWKELLLMKEKQVTENSNISVFDILCSSEHKLLYYARNEEIVENFFKIQVDNLYPDYGRNMISRFQRACNEQNLIQNTIDILSNNIKQLNSNLEIIANILRFLSLDDLAILCKI